MSQAKKADTSAQLIALQKSFSEQLPGRLENIRLLWKAVLTNREEMEQLRELHLKIHNLVGSAGTFGAISISKAALPVETHLNLILETDGVDEEKITELQRLLDHLDKTIINWRPTGLPYISPLLSTQKPKQHNNLIFLVEDDVDIANELSAQLEKADYRVQHFAKLNEFKKACSTSNLPGTIIMDLVFEEGNIAGAEIINELRKEWHVLPPIVFISVRNDSEARLATVRAGASRFFQKPIDYSQLRQTVDGLTGRLVKTPYRVLVVDDQKSLLDYYAVLLKDIGIKVKALSDPMQVLPVIEDFHPDLILMDVYMPECSGLELASMIRQDDKWAQVPIVFLSNELELEKQLTALNLGGDDFLTKPVERNHLISAVLARLKRARWITRLNRNLNEALKKSQYLKIALDQHSIVSITDAQGVITEINDKFCEISGYRREELIGQTHHLINSGTHSKEFFQQMWAVINQGNVWHGIICNRAKQGALFWNEMTIVPFLDDEDKPYQYIAICTDITAIKSARDDLVRAKEEAENANLAKSQFLSKMSHELRTPLNVILGFAYMMKKDKKFPLAEPQLEGINEISMAGKHLLDLINEVLDLAQIESGHIDLNLRPVPLQDLIEECRSLISPLLLKYQLQWGDQSSSCGKLSVSADYTRLKQVLLNLLSNACKYNRAGGRVIINCEERGDGWLRIIVSDTGAGIAEEDYKKLFKPFSRISSNSNHIEGAGIGLLVTKQLIELMGGNIGFDSIPEKGTRFWIELPESDVTPDIIDNRNVMDTTPPETMEHAGTILYIEDNPANLRMVTKLLTSQTNLRVLTAQLPEKGIEIAREYLPDLILLDINLPGMDGFEVLRQLRTDKTTDEIPVIAISANAMPHDIEKGLNADFVEYLTKPIDVDELMTAIDFVFKI